MARGMVSGLTRKNNFASLHGNRSKGKAIPETTQPLPDTMPPPRTILEVDIDAPPLDSSSSGSNSDVEDASIVESPKLVTQTRDLGGQKARNVTAPPKKATKATGKRGRENGNDGEEHRRSSGPSWIKLPKARKRFYGGPSYPSAGATKPPPKRLNTPPVKPISTEPTANLSVGRQLKLPTDLESPTRQDFDEIDSKDLCNVEDETMLRRPLNFIHRPGFSPTKGPELINLALPGSSAPSQYNDSLLDGADPGSPADSSQTSLASPDAARIVRENEVSANGMKKCSVCKKEIPNDFSLKPPPRKGASWQERTEYCKVHDRELAEADWRSRGFPKIDWSKLQQRAEEKWIHIEDVLYERVEHSFFIDEAKAKMKDGRAKTLKETMATEESLVPTTGYYGSRGATIMNDALMEHFGRTFDEIQSTNKVLATYGVAAYVQLVLVPELAVALIQDDMGIKDYDAAVKIMADSRDLGETLNGEDSDDDMDNRKERNRDPFADTDWLFEDNDD